MDNETAGVAPEQATEDQTSQTNESTQETQENPTEDNLETLKAQKQHWRDKAIDPETGKSYKELFESKKTEKPKAEKKEKSDDSLLQKAYLRSADITSEDEVELALETAKKWDMPVDKLVDDEDFKVKLEKLRTTKSNEQATSNVRGDGAKTSAKDTPEYWIAKGTPPTKEDVPEASKRRKINTAFLKAHKGGQNKRFYND